MGKTKQKYTKKQKALIREVEKDPEASDYQIAKNMNNLGLDVSHNYINQTLKGNNQIREKITKLRENYELKLLKNVPKADKVIKHHLNENSLDAAKTVLKHALPTYDESKRPPVQQTVNIQEIRTIIYNDMQDEDNDVIEAQS